MVEWINSPKIRETVSSTITPKTIDMQWNWIENELSSKTRILLKFVIRKIPFFDSLSTINFENRSAQISTISPIKKIKKINYVFAKLGEQF